MALEIKQSLRLSQQLVMTPQLQQAIKLLQLNRLELADVITNELMENPLLEEVSETMENPEGLPENASEQERADANTDAASTSEAQPELPPAEQTAKDDFDWESYIDDVNNNQSNLPSSKISTEDLPSFENTLTKTESLTEHLMWQLNMSTLTDQEKKLGLNILGNLDDDGYLIVTLDELIKDTDIQLEDAEEILKVIQRFDPPGVASRSVQECLRIQAEFLDPPHATVEKIIEHHLGDLEKRNYQTICRALGLEMSAIVEATKIIQQFEPKPGRLFMATDNTQYITPDIYVVKNAAGEYIITLNDDGLPKLRVSNYYKSVLTNASAQSKAQGGGKTVEGAKSNVTRDYIQDKLRAAIWLIRSIHNRQKTIFKVTESIVKYQKDFFEKGSHFLKPLILKEVANDIGMHESTVSRVTSNKYVHTPMGIFELKYFFNSAISGSDGGGDVASEAVKDKIRGMLSKEDPRKPLSDQRIVELLQADNIDIARRTVAKYRDMLGILSSSKRKKPF